MLLEKGGAVGVRDALGRNVLHTAAEMESQHALPVMRMLLAEGSPARDHVNDQDQDGRTPLYFAARNAHKSAPLIVRLLIGMDMHLSGTLRDSLGFSGILWDSSGCWGTHPGWIIGDYWGFFPSSFKILHWRIFDVRLGCPIGWFEPSSGVSDNCVLGSRASLILVGFHCQAN